MEKEKIKELENRYPLTTGIKYVKKTRGKALLISEETYNSCLMYQSARNWERHCNNAYQDYQRDCRAIEWLVHYEHVKDVFKEIFSLGWLVNILRRARQLLQFILIGKTINKKQRKLELRLWKNQQSSWIPENITKRS